MSKPKAQIKLLPFDAARYLTDDAAVADYITAVLEIYDPYPLLLHWAMWHGPVGWLRSPKRRASGERACTKLWPPGQSRALRPS